MCGREMPQRRCVPIGREEVREQGGLLDVRGAHRSLVILVIFSTFPAIFLCVLAGGGGKRCRVRERGNQQGRPLESKERAAAALRRGTYPSNSVSRSRWFSSSILRYSAVSGSGVGERRQRE